MTGLTDWRQALLVFTIKPTCPECRGKKAGPGLGYKAYRWQSPGAPTPANCSCQLVQNALAQCTFPCWAPPKPRCRFPAGSKFGHQPGQSSLSPPFCHRACPKEPYRSENPNKSGHHPHCRSCSISRGGKYLTVQVDRRGAGNPIAVGRRVVTPQKLPIFGRNPNQGFRR